MSKTLFPDKKHEMHPNSLKNLIPGPKGLYGKQGRRKKVASILDDLIESGMIPNVKNIQDLKDRAIAIQCAMMYSGDANLMMAASNKILEYTHPKGINLSGNVDNNIIVSFNMPAVVTAASGSKEVEGAKYEVLPVVQPIVIDEMLQDKINEAFGEQPTNGEGKNHAKDKSI